MNIYENGENRQKNTKNQGIFIQEYIFIPNNHFIFHFNIYITNLNFLTAILVCMYIIITLNLHILMQSLTYICFQQQCYMMVHVDSMKHFIRHIIIFLFLMILSLTFPLTSLQLMLISLFA